MNTYDPSDERLNAWIDGELTADEAEELLDRMRRDAALRERVAELRLSKDLVRHAYAGLRPPAAEAVLPAARRPTRAAALAAGLAVLGVGLLAGWLARGPAVEATVAHAPAAGVARSEVAHVVLHVSAAAQGPAVLDRAQGILEAARASARPVALEIVANSGGLDLLRQDTSAHAARIAALRRAYPELVLVACGQTVQRLRASGLEVQLLPGTTTATSALDQIVLRMQQGWAYVRI